MHSRLTVYRASAGSGKTFTLAVQYIKLLIATAGGTNYRHILAVTFTNKATAEMKDRILQQLYGIWKSIPSSHRYLEALKAELARDGLNGLTDEDIRLRAGRALRNILHDYSRFRVETIDSFFQSVLKNLAHELSLTANLQVDLNDKEMLGHAVDSIMSRLHLEPRTLSWILEYVDDRINNDDRWDVSRETKDFARWIFSPDYLAGSEALRAVLDNDKRMLAYRRKLHEIKAGTMDTLTSAVAHFREELETRGLVCTDFKTGATLNTYLNALTEKGFDADFKPTLQKYLESPENMLVAAKKKDRQWLDAAAHFQELLQEIRNFQLSLAEDYNTASLALKHLNPLRLLGCIDEEVTSLTNETNRFLLAKTPILLNNLIEESDAPFIFEKMGTEFHYVMIDEFQDTSTLQWRNFKILLLENLAGGGNNLLVGDVKQSIYRWRNGDWTILNNIGEEMKAHRPLIRQLAYNYRSERRIINFNNAVFDNAARLLDGLHPNARLKISEAYKDVKQECPAGKKNEGYVCACFYPNKRKTAECDWEALMLENLCDRVSELHRAGVDYSQMAILLRQRKHAAPVVARFAERLPDVKLVSDEAFRLSSSTGVNMLIAALHVLDDPDDKVSLAYLALHYRHDIQQQALDLNEVLIAQNPDEHLPETFTAATERLRLMPLYELQEELFRLFSLEKLEKQDAYLFAYFDQVTAYLQDNPSDIHSFLAFWDEQLSAQTIPSGEMEGIRIFTIHKSKGLQFHTVFIPYCHWDVERDKNTTLSNDLLWCAPGKEPYNELPLIPVSPCGQMKNSIFRDAYEEEHLQRRVDALNTLYVALTRAEKNLFVWAKAKPEITESGTVGDLLCAALPTDLEGAVLEEEDITTFTYGTPVTTQRAAGRETDNRMELSYSNLPVKMRSFASRIEFKQSNRSERFICQAGDEDMPDTPTAPEQNTYIRQGKLLHYIFSTLHTADELETVLRQFESEGVLGKEIQKERLRKWVTKGLERPMIADWFSGRYRLYNECSILSTDAATGECIVRRPDRVMTDDREIIVTDFKFGKPRPEYHDQVREYMHLLQQMEPQKAVKGYLWFVYTNKIEEIKG